MESAFAGESVRDTAAAAEISKKGEEEDKRRESVVFEAELAAAATEESRDGCSFMEAFVVIKGRSEGAEARFVTRLFQ